MELKEEMFSIVYLFMNCDGNISDEEKEKFSLLLENYNKTAFSSIFITDIIVACKRVFDSAFDKDDLPNVIEQKIKEIIRYTYFSYEEKISLLWLLVDFAYADGTCAESEKKLLRSIFHMLELTDKSILYDLEDTAKAALAIETRRNRSWLATWFSPTQSGNGDAKKLDYETGKKLLEELDEEQNVLVKSINELIEEGED